MFHRGRPWKNEQTQRFGMLTGRPTKQIGGQEIKIKHFFLEFSPRGMFRAKPKALVSVCFPIDFVFLPENRGLSRQVFGLGTMNHKKKTSLLMNFLSIKKLLFHSSTERKRAGKTISVYFSTFIIETVLALCPRGNLRLPHQATQNNSSIVAIFDVTLEIPFMVKMSI